MIDTTVKSQSGIDTWFDTFVAGLRTHKIQLETLTASREIKDIYETLFSGDADEIAHMGKMQAQKHFVTRIVVEFLSLIQQSKPDKLAFDFNDSEVLVWSEISNDNELMEHSLLKAQAIINAKFHPFGFDMEMTIVEHRDQLNIPNHYQVFIS